MSTNRSKNGLLERLLPWISNRPTFRRRAPAFLIACIGAIVGFMPLIPNLLFANQAAQMEEPQFKLVATTIDFNVKTLQHRAALAADAINNIAKIKRLHAAKNREGLLAELEKSFSVLKEKYSVDQIQLHSLPAVSLLPFSALSPLQTVMLSRNRSPHGRIRPSKPTKTGLGIFSISDPRTGRR